MSKLSNKTCLVYDHAGLYVHVALALARGFGRVLYFSQWRDAFSESRNRHIGEGFDEFERLRDFEDGLNDADIVVFPDVGLYKLEDHLRVQGFPVWGMGQAEQLEDDKIFFHHWLMTQEDLPKPDMWSIEGIDALEDFLQKREDVFVKSNDRGDFETYHHKTWWKTESWFDALTAKIGPYKHEVQLIAQAGVVGCEMGYDGYCVDGDFPPTAQCGFELKGDGYIGRIVPYGRLPLPLQQSNTAVAQWIKSEEMSARGAISTEVRMSKVEVGYFIDPTMRFGIPPSHCQMAGYKNWPDIIWGGANGVIVDLDCPYKYLAEIEFTSSWANTHYMPVSWPKEYRSLCYLDRWYRFEDKDYVVPPFSKDDRCGIGSAFGMGDTIKEATEMALEVAASVEAYDLNYNEALFDKLDETLGEYAKLGLEF